MFGTLTITCGTTHWIEIWTLWYPTYWFSGLVKGISAFAFISTFVLLIPRMAKALALPSSTQLEALNCQLANEIAERKRVEKELQKSEERWQLTWRGNRDGIWDWNIKTSEVFFSPRWKEMLGYEEGEIENYLDEWSQRIHPDDVDWVTQVIQNHWAKRTPFYMTEHRVLSKDGTYRWILDRGQALWDEDGEPVRMIGSHTDITERKQAEEALNSVLDELQNRVEERTVELTKLNNSLTKINESLQIEIGERKRAEAAVLESESRLQLALNATHTGIWDWNILANSFIWSNNNLALLDLEKGPFNSTYTAFLESVHPDDREKVALAVTRSIENREEFNVEFRIIWSDGSVHWMASKGQVFYNEASNPVRMVGTVVDINERKRVENQIKASLEEKEVLLKEIHHRVKNNLQIVSSLLNLQAEYLRDEQALEIFKVSQNRIESMALIHEKLYQSKDLTKINFADYIRDLVTTLFCSYTVESTAIKFKIDVDGVFLGLDTAIPCGLIIAELVVNSLKHAFPASKEGGEIRISLCADDTNQLTLVVSDDGIGFPPGFNFMNTESLGLQLVEALTKQLDGIIEIDTDSGVKFKISFTKQELIKQCQTQKF